MKASTNEVNQPLLHYLHPKETEPRYIGRLLQVNLTVLFYLDIKSAIVYSLTIRDEEATK